MAYDHDTLRDHWRAVYVLELWSGTHCLLRCSLKADWCIEDRGLWIPVV